MDRVVVLRLAFKIVTACGCCNLFCVACLPLGASLDWEWDEAYPGLGQDHLIDLKDQDTLDDLDLVSQSDLFDLLPLLGS